MVNTTLTLEDVRTRSHEGKCIFHNRHVDVSTTVVHVEVPDNTVSIGITVEVSCALCRVAGVDGESRSTYRGYGLSPKAARSFAKHFAHEESDLMHAVLVERNTDLLEQAHAE